MTDGSFTPSHVTSRLKSLSLDSDPNFRFQEEKDPTSQYVLTLRALITSKEAGMVIGKEGKNVNDIRENTGARAGVSKVVPGVATRILTISGQLDVVVKAYVLVARSLAGGLESNSASLRILVAHSLMGTIIGRMGTKIKQIQETSGAKMIANKEMLPQSTERVVEIQGTPEAIGLALTEMGLCILAEWEKTSGTILFNPVQQLSPPSPFYTPYTPEIGFRREPVRFDPMSPGLINPMLNPLGNPLMSPLNLITKRLSIAADMVGCVIGKQGSKIAEIRRLSNAKVSIAKETDHDSNTRLFTIYGSHEANDTAIYLIYAQLEAEKDRRTQLALQSHPTPALLN
ncbi:RNA binding protein, heterogenous nuclear RNP-K like protein [Entomophthora muscae]|uniref:RNA binding protein, heterogenous nuclear RNP-K like protein n=1 Tax=Entomophthora muscae TaxID=34485 RepID=A0ACC2UR33_9FUNG|nr:RNA binding protein, heterogenous nuclear RNP-K like protein [Entomophthora muscae]